MIGKHARTGNPRGFTLIELLIVVAIIAILAAIAVPNFLEAQTRSKVSRVLSDLRTMRTAVETYAVDTNRYPRTSWGCGPGGAGGSGPGDAYQGQPIWGTLVPWEITTPISYLTSLPRDPFAAGDTQDWDAIFYTYQEVNSKISYASKGYSCPVPGERGFIYVVTAPSLRATLDYMGLYFLWSIGPAGTDQPEFYMQYDSTNGTISEGRVFVSQKFSSPTYVPYQAF